MDTRIHNVDVPLDTSVIDSHVCEISTRTITCVQSSVVLSIKDMYDNIDPVVYTDIELLKEGSIIYIKYELLSKGRLPKRQRRERTNVFRNSLTVIIYVSDSKGRCKLVNMKIPPSGMIQFTGCLEYYQSIRALYYFLDAVYTTCPYAIILKPEQPTHVVNHSDNIWVRTVHPSERHRNSVQSRWMTPPSDTQPKLCDGRKTEKEVTTYTCKFTFKVHMTNIKVHLTDRNVNRTTLHHTINKYQNWRASFDASGYSGVNVKMGYTTGTLNSERVLPVDIPIPVVTYNFDPLKMSKSLSFEHITTIRVSTYDDYYKLLSDDMKLHERQWFSNKNMTILVFQTGTMTLSGIHEWLMAPLWKEFITFMHKHQTNLFFGKDIIIVDY